MNSGGFLRATGSALAASSLTLLVVLLASAAALSGAAVAALFGATYGVAVAYVLVLAPIVANLKRRWLLRDVEADDLEPSFSSVVLGWFAEALAALTFPGVIWWLGSRLVPPLGRGGFATIGWAALLGLAACVIVLALLQTPLLWIASERRLPFAKVLKKNLIVMAVLLPVILALASPAGVWTARSALRQASPQDIAGQTRARIYYFDGGSNQLMRVRLDSEPPTKAGDAKGVPGAWLATANSEIGDLRLLSHEPTGARPVLEHVADAAFGPFFPSYHPELRPRDNPNATRVFEPIELGRFHADVLPLWGGRSEGVELRVTDRHGPPYRIGFDNVLARWMWRCVTVLPGGLAVAEFGPQVVLVDLRRKTMARLADGYGPTVVLEPQPPKTRAAMPWEWFYPEGFKFRAKIDDEPTKKPPFPTRSKRRRR